MILYFQATLGCHTEPKTPQWEKSVGRSGGYAREGYEFVGKIYLHVWIFFINLEA